MSNFTVSARKYRPGTFETVVGQEHVTNTLKNAIIKGHIGHAFLFCGPRGVGKTTCARILAKALNCQNLGTDGEPCGVCDACKSFSTQQSFNIYELDAASNNSVDDIRSLVEQVRFAPQNGKYKIYIIDEVHMLSQAAFNAFLKTLEEPPSYAIFILATTEKHKIIPTILSRCQIYDFHRINIKSIIEQLKSICKQENIVAEDEGLYVIAQKADGALRDALSIFDRVVSFSGDKISYKDVIENLNVLDYEYYFKVIDLVSSQDLPGSMLLFDEILRNGFDSHNFLNGISEHLRNLLICKDPSTIKLMELSEGTQNQYLQQAIKTSVSFIVSALNILNQFDVNFKASKNQRLHVELALMKLCYLRDVLQIPANMEALLAEKKKPELNAGNESAKSSFEPQVAVQVSAPAARPGPKASFDLKKMRDEAAQKRKNNGSDIAESKEEEVFERVDQAIFSKAWLQYMDNLRARGKNPLAVMGEKSKIENTDEGWVVVSLGNEGLKNQFNDELPEFKRFLNNLNIFNIKISYLFVPPTEEEFKKYVIKSDADKFRDMVDKNPALSDMQQRFGLRLEF